MVQHAHRQLPHIDVQRLCQSPAPGRVLAVQLRQRGTQQRGKALRSITDLCRPRRSRGCSTCAGVHMVDLRPFPTQLSISGG